MKAVFIIYNQAHTEKVEYLFEKLNIRGFTRWTDLSRPGQRGWPPAYEHPYLAGTELSQYGGDGRRNR